jgi:hypothetical protein
MSLEREATTIMPFTNGMTRQEVRLVSCPKCGASSTYMCLWPQKHDPSVHRRLSRIHKHRINKATEYRTEHRI